MNSAPEVLVGQLVIADFDGPWMVIGRLQAAGPDWLEFADADLHDLGEGSSTRDVYALETQKLGVRVNRRRVSVPLSRVVALSRLDDVTA